MRAKEFNGPENSRLWGTKLVMICGQLWSQGKELGQMFDKV